jgi:hypothetical protein
MLLDSTAGRPCRRYEIGDPLQVIFASCAVSLAASEDGSGAYGSWLELDPSVC